MYWNTINKIKIIKMEEEGINIAIINPDKCKPEKCKQECLKTCPANKSAGKKESKICIKVLPNSVVSLINEKNCIGCGMCVIRCPFEAIKIVKNFPKRLQKEVTHRFGANTFILHKLPAPRLG
jgi:ATP-binding cassette, sub-family E, member 1